MKRTANNGSFKKGNVPYNKGTNISSRKHHTRKGVQGFLKRAVLMIAQDGSVVREFESVAECQKYLGLKDRHSISYAIKNNSCALDTNCCTKMTGLLLEITGGARQ